MRALAQRVCCVSLPTVARWPLEVGLGTLAMCAGDSLIWNAGHCDTSRVPDSRPQVRGRAWAPPVQVSGAYDRLGIWSTPPCTAWVGPEGGSGQRGRCRERAAEPRTACAHPACGQVLRGGSCSRSVEAAAAGATMRSPGSAADSRDVGAGWSCIASVKVSLILESDEKMDGGSAPLHTRGSMSSSRREKVPRDLTHERLTNLATR